METEKQTALIPVSEAQENVLRHVIHTEPEEISSAGAVDRVTREDLRAQCSIPAFDNSAMDGYAVHHQDLMGATPDAPVKLPLIGEIQAGMSDSSRLKFSRGSCIRIFTGAPVPEGSSAVVMQEDCRVDGDSITFSHQPKPWEFVRLAGEDIRAGDIILPAGERINPRIVGTLRSAGIASMRVGRPPVISVMATGNELVEPGNPLAAGMIYESNRHMIAGMVNKSGGIPKIGTISGDTTSSIAENLASEASSSHFIITTGGISVGKYDLVKSAWESIGGEWLTSRINMKPGKPFSFGKYGKCLLFALPGNPVSAAMTFMLFVYPAIQKSLGAQRLNPTQQKAMAARDIVSRQKRTEFLRITQDSEMKITPLNQQGSHCIGGLTQSDGYLEIHPDQVFKEGSLISFTPWPF